MLLSGPSSAASLSSSRVRLRAFHALSLCGLSHLTTHFVAGPAPSSVLFHRAFQPLKPVCQTPVWAPRAPSIFVAFAFTRTPILKPFAIENSVIAAIKSNEPNVQNQKRGQADKGLSCVYHVPAYRSITYCRTKVTSYQMCVTPGERTFSRGNV